ncbi:MAG: hypothetical protein MZU95_14315 [Desulfomicrobium escambiense]|nr:hypothetical protein [Desulfomicrobium escambiense]
MPDTVMLGGDVAVDRVDRGDAGLRIIRCRSRCSRSVARRRRSTRGAARRLDRRHRFSTVRLIVTVAESPPESVTVKVIVYGTFVVDIVGFEAADDDLIGQVAVFLVGGGDAGERGVFVRPS